MTAQIEVAPRAHLAKQQRDLPEMLWLVIHADREPRPRAADELARAAERIHLGALDVQLQVRSQRVRQDIIERDRGNDVASTGRERAGFACRGLKAQMVDMTRDGARPNRDLGAVLP